MLCRVLALVFTLLSAVLPVSAATTTISGGNLGDATRTLRGGDTLVLTDGEYSGCIDDSIPSGSAGSPTTIKAANPRQAILRASCKGGDDSSVIVIGLRQERSYITLEGFVVDGRGNRGIGVHFRQPTTDGSTRSHHLTLINVEVKNLAWTNDPSGTFGLAMAAGHDFLLRGNHVHEIGMDTPSDAHWLSYCMYWGATNSIVEDNEFDHCSGYGIHGYFSAQGGTISGTGENIIRRNVIHDNGAIGILNCAANNTIYGNVIANNGWHQRDPGGMQIGGYCSGVQADNNRVYNNTLVSNTTSCIRVGVGGSGSGNNNAIQNNICWKNGGGDRVEVANGGGNTIDHNLLGTNPMFVGEAAGDYHLGPGSPALKAGVPMPEIVGNPPDLGAMVGSGGGGSGTPGPTPPAPTNLRLLPQH